MSTPPIDTIIIDDTAVLIENTVVADPKMLNESIAAMAHPAIISASRGISLGVSLAMQIVPARSYSGRGRFAEVMQMLAWVTDNTASHSIRFPDVEFRQAISANDFIEFQITFADDAEAVAFSLRWLGGDQ